MDIRSLFSSPRREFAVVGVLALAFSIDALSGYGQIALAVASVLAVWPTAVEAGKSLRRLTLSIDTFNTFAVVASFFIGELRSAAFIGLMLAFARYLDWRTASRSHRAIEELMRLKPDIARRETSDGVEDIPSEQVQQGDVVIAAIGTRVPVDGVIIGGEAHLNEASVTGESRLIHKTIGDRVVSSALVESGGIRIRATNVGKDSTIERMAALIREATEHKSRAEKLADKFAGMFLPLIALLGLGTYALTQNLSMVASIFLVACADDMAVAIPLAITAAVGRAAKRGVILKGGEWLDVLARTNVIILDKTGTLTYGSLALAQVRIAHGIDEQMFWRAVGSAEKFSEHPTGRLAYAEAIKRVPRIVDPISVEVLKGRGVRAETMEGEVAIGNTRLADELGYELPANVKEESGVDIGSAFYVFIDKLFAGTVCISDEPRPEASMSLHRLRELGIARVMMFTGDNERTAVAVSKRLGMTEVRANMLPIDKLKELERLLPAGPVAMVGDGINDAPALARSDVGIAMGGGGTAIASEAADVVILSDDLSRLPEMIELGRETNSVIHWDMAIWGITNLFGFVLVFTGFLGPSLAAFYNFATDFLPLLNSTRLFRRFPEKETAVS